MVGSIIASPPVTELALDAMQLCKNRTATRTLHRRQTVDLLTNLTRIAKVAMSSSGAFIAAIAEYGATGAKDFATTARSQQAIRRGDRYAVP
jgi:hypothetical protein